MHIKATGDEPVAAPVGNGIHYDISVFKVYPVKHSIAIVNKFESTVGAEQDFYPTLHFYGTPETK